MKCVTLSAERDITAIKNTVFVDQVKSLYELVPLIERLKKIELKEEFEGRNLKEQLQELMDEKLKKEVDY